MAQASESSELFDWLTDDHLEELLVKLKQLPSGGEFGRRVEDALAETIGIDRTYDAIVEDHGDLVGYVDESESQLPWWLTDFEWTVTADALDSLQLSGRTLDSFENYPIDSVEIENISINDDLSLIDGLNAFIQIQQHLSDALNVDLGTVENKVDVDSNEYTLPSKLFVVSSPGQISTTNEFNNWFEQIIGLCPPSAPEMTALLRTNANIQYRHAKKVLSEDDLQRLVDLGIFNSTDERARAYDENLQNSVRALLDITLPFDLELDIDAESEELTPLQRHYYISWASDTPDRLPNEQQWLRKAKDADDIRDDEELPFAEYAFRMPIRLDGSKALFEAQEGPIIINRVRQEIGDILDSYGHPVNDG